MVTVCSVLEEAGIEKDVQLAIASREEPTGVFELV